MMNTTTLIMRDSYTTWKIKDSKLSKLEEIPVLQERDIKVQTQVITDLKTDLQTEVLMLISIKLAGLVKFINRTCHPSSTWVSSQGGTLWVLEILHSIFRRADLAQRVKALTVRASKINSSFTASLSRLSIKLFQEKIFMFLEIFLSLVPIKTSSTVLFGLRVTFGFQKSLWLPKLHTFLINTCWLVLKNRWLTKKKVLQELQISVCSKIWPQRPQTLGMVSKMLRSMMFGRNLKFISQFIIQLSIEIKRCSLLEIDPNLDALFKWKDN